MLVCKSPCVKKSLQVMRYAMHQLHLWWQSKSDYWLNVRSYAPWILNGRIKL